MSLIDNSSQFNIQAHNLEDLNKTVNLNISYNNFIVTIFDQNFSFDSNQNRDLNIQLSPFNAGDFNLSFVFTDVNDTELQNNRRDIIFSNQQQTLPNLVFVNVDLSALSLSVKRCLLFLVIMHGMSRNNRRNRVFVY